MPSIGCPQRESEVMGLEVCIENLSLSNAGGRADFSGRPNLKRWFNSLAGEFSSVAELTGFSSGINCITDEKAFRCQWLAEVASGFAA